MEVLGAVASAVTLAEMTAKGVGFLRQIPEVQYEFLALCDEISFIKDICGDVEKALNSNEKATLAADKNGLVSRAKTTLWEIATRLAQIQTKCERLTAEGKPEASKRKWIIREGQISMLLAKAQSAKGNLNLAMNTETARNTAETVKQQYQMGIQLGALSHKLDTTIAKVESKLSHITQVVGIMMPFQGQQLVTSQTTTGSPKAQIQELDEDGNELESDHPEVDLRGGQATETTEQIVTKTAFVAMGRKTCSEDCGCRCHLKPWAFSTPHWVGQLIGSWQVKKRPSKPRNRWELSCSCDKSKDLLIEWTPPNWPWIKLFLTAPSYPLTCALRPARVFPYGFIESQLGHPLRPARVFSYGFIESQLGHPHPSAERFQLALQDGLVLFPDDRNEFGELYTERLIDRDGYGVLEILMVEWANILPSQGLERGAMYAANFQIDRGMVDERASLLLSKMLSFADGELEQETTPVHEAAKQGTGVQEAIEQSRISKNALNMLDAKGRAPIHWAVLCGHKEAVQELTVASADLNCKDYRGHTPLMIAAIRNDTELMRLLLSAGRSRCRIDVRDQYGYTALHWAANYGHSEAVRLLLEEGANASACDARGDNPLHLAALSGSEGATPAEIDVIFNLLFNAQNVDIEAQNNYGNTPLMAATMYNQLDAMRCLVDAGATSTAIATDSRNILHYAASYSTLEVLEFLHSLNLSGISTYRQDNNGDTPWDTLLFFAQLQSTFGDGVPRIPTKDEIIAFVQLYKGIRERNIRNDLSLLKPALEAISANKGITACSYLSTLVESKKRSGDTDTAEFYRGIEKSVLAGDRKKAADIIKQDIEELGCELATSPWDQPSRRYTSDMLNIREVVISENGGRNPDENELSEGSEENEDNEESWETLEVWEE